MRFCLITRCEVVRNKGMEVDNGDLSHHPYEHDGGGGRKNQVLQCPSRHGGRAVPLDARMIPKM